MLFSKTRFFSKSILETEHVFMDVDENSFFFYMKRMARIAAHVVPMAASQLKLEFLMSNLKNIYMESNM